jgi:ribosomal protein S18 acetylase RimI-like enzyme
MIRFIPVEDTLAMRNAILREGKFTLDECRFPTDKIDGAFHLGYFEDDQLICIASFHPQHYKGYQGLGYQLRGMATLEEYRGKGIGNQLVNFAIVYLRGQKANYVWCNARINALRFYQNIGFEVISEQFVIPITGPHHVLYLKIQ